jgi:SlyX protein
MSEQRFIELEIKMAYQEDLLQDLNQIVVRQQGQIDRLEAICAMLLDRMQVLQALADAESVDQPPPHY